MTHDSAFLVPERTDPTMVALHRREWQWPDWATGAALDPLAFDADAARHYGSVYAAVTAAGRAPRRRFADLLIACIAIANDLPLYTTNPKGFGGLDDLLEVRPVARPG